MFKLTESVFCAFCKLKRNVYRFKHLTWTNVLLSAALSILLMYGFFQGVDGRVVVFFSTFVILAEIFVYLRWRLAIKCPHCAFDPILYRSDRKKCVSIVKSRLDDLKLSGRYMLKQNNPFENLPTREIDSKSKNKSSIRPKPRSAGKSDSSRFLSRQV